MHTLNEIKSILKEAIDKIIPVQTQGGRAGQLVWVQTSQGRIQAKCVSDIKAGSAIALLTEQGRWWLAGELAQTEKTSIRYKEYRQTKLTKRQKQEQALSAFFILQEARTNDIPIPPGYTQKVNLGSAIAKQYTVAVLWANLQGTGYIAYYDEDNNLVEQTIDLPGGIVSATEPVIYSAPFTFTGKGAVFFRAEFTVLEFEGLYIEFRQLDVDKWETYFCNSSGVERLNLTEVEYPAIADISFYCAEEKVFYFILNQTPEYSIEEDEDRIIIIGEPRNKVIYKLNPKTLTQVKNGEIESVASGQLCGFEVDNPCYFDGTAPLFGNNNYRFRGKSERLEITNLEEVRTKLKNGESADIEYTIYSLSNNGASCTATPLSSGIQRVNLSSETVDLINEFSLIIYPFLYV